MVTIEFNYPLNTSVQVGDLAFAQQVLTTTYAEADGGISGLELIGEISAINDRATNNPSIVINNENFIPFANDFICFASSSFHSRICFSVIACIVFLFIVPIP